MKSPIGSWLARHIFPLAAGTIMLVLFRTAFFNPDMVTGSGFIDQIVKGLAAKQMQEIDTFVIDDLRNFLFGQPGEGGMDLISLNIQRGRDHGIPAYNDAREALGLSRRNDFSEMTSNPMLARALGSVYDHPDQVDLWVGAVAEDHLAAANVGETVAAGLRKQFIHLRDGDRFFFLFDEALDAEDKARIRNTRLADVIARNTRITTLQENAFMSNPAALMDTDGDGEPDLGEAIAGTDPEDPDSLFRVIDATRTGEELAIRWSSVAGKDYSVEYSVDGRFWKSMAMVRGKASETTFFDPVLAMAGRDVTLYRIGMRE